jgi:hypothetical protein
MPLLRGRQARQSQNLTHWGDLAASESPHLPEHGQSAVRVKNRPWLRSAGMVGGMDRSSLQLRLKEADGLVQRMEENIVFQRQMIATLDRGGHDVKAAKMFLKRLEAKHEKHVADRDRLFKELTNRF